MSWQGALALTVLVLLVLSSIALRSATVKMAVAISSCVALALSGAADVTTARASLETLAPTVCFLAFSLILARLCANEGLFRYVGERMRVLAKGSPRMLFVWVVVFASTVTAIMSLDATVLLLTPVVLSAAVDSDIPPEPYLYATGHLANSASLLLPVSNLTNLLAFGLSGLTFSQFMGLSALPWIMGVLTEYVVLRVAFRTDLRSAPVLRDHQTARSHPGSTAVRVRTTVVEADMTPSDAAPTTAVVVVGMALAGFFICGTVGVEPLWVALAACIILSTTRVARSRTGVREESRLWWHASNVPFLLFVLSLGMSIEVLRSHGGAMLASALVHGSQSLPALLATAFGAAILANVINNLPAAMLLIPAASTFGAPAVMAVLIGVNIGPNLTYVGSLANLLWVDICDRALHRPRLRQFTLISAVSVPLCLTMSVLGLWLSTQR
ncbi:SLC13 family permease [uncultured Bifidobacterium sp.]|uniref:SLC13 family permease n=1 Tax=uncultured Bifidobacterium sp. TaxID=165187 RepID=UPI00262CD606|nr:SLC13 family permease [uncultured Bifidobacterium sp.]